MFPKNHILRMKGLVSKSECKKIIHYFDSNPELHYAGFGGVGFNENLKKDTEISCNFAKSNGPCWIKKYLKIAIMLMPRDPVINDHFADCLWMNDNKIQARYYWNNALEFDADDKLKKKIKRKILFGLEDI